MSNNTTIDKVERITQNKVIKFFEDPHYLNYKYIGNFIDKENHNIRSDSFIKFLKSKNYSEDIIKKAYLKIKEYAICEPQNLYSANKKFYEILRYGLKDICDENNKPITIHIIDWNNPTNNIFEIAEEVTVIANLEKRPDLVIYVNGIALSVIELKRSSVSISEGIAQQIGNQQPMFIERFFTTAQILVAGNEFEGLKYATTKTAEKFWNKWKDDGYEFFKEERDGNDIAITDKISIIKNETNDNILLCELYQLFDKNRFLDIIRNFIIFDGGVKKVCRYYQYFAVKRCINRIKNKKNGIIWHSQGSGKTLTMVFLSNYILSEQSGYPNARVLIITDRDELDEQIEKKYSEGLKQRIVRPKSIETFINELNTQDSNLICALIHKFGRRNTQELIENDKEKLINKSYEEYLDELKRRLPIGFKAKGDIFVFVDECHRTQSGKLHAAMEKIIPNAVFFGFSGTPLLKDDKEKKSSVSVFGSFIHRYSYEEAVSDGVILDLRYNGRNIDQEIPNDEKIDEWFERKTVALSNKAKDKLKKRWGTLQKVFSSKNRINKIVDDIALDFETKSRLIDGKGNAILVADSIFNACRYFELFNQIPEFKHKTAIITSFMPNSNNVSKEFVSDDGEETESFLKYRVYMQMLGLDMDNLPKDLNIEKKVEKFEKDAKKLFVEEPNNMKLLIVVDKLLTGFDAPHCTYLYLDSKLKDHNLFQAICRPNRLDEDKDFGYIVDYKQLFDNLLSSMKDFAGTAFENLNMEGCENIIKDEKSEAVKSFFEAVDKVDNICFDVKLPKGDKEYKEYFCLSKYENTDEEDTYERLRQKLYSAVSRLFNTWMEAKKYLSEDYDNSKVKDYEKKVSFYINLKNAISEFSGDALNFRLYDPDMRKMIDRFIDADNSVELGAFDDFTLLDFINAKQKEMENLEKDGKGNTPAKEGIADTIINNVRKKIIEKRNLNPMYYDKMSKILNDIIDLQKKGVENYIELLKKYKDLARDVEKPDENTDLPPEIKGDDIKCMLYYNSGFNTEPPMKEVALKLYDAFINNREQDFQMSDIKQKKIKGSLYEALKNYIVSDEQRRDEVERLYKLLAIY